jgi:hypothetical protein
MGVGEPGRLSKSIEHQIHIGELRKIEEDGEFVGVMFLDLIVIFR